MFEHVTKRKICRNEFFTQKPKCSAFGFLCEKFVSTNFSFCDMLKHTARLDSIEGFNFITKFPKLAKIVNIQYNAK